MILNSTDKCPNLLESKTLTKITGVETLIKCSETVPVCVLHDYVMTKPERHNLNSIRDNTYL